MIPITVFTGFLGAGKTTLILSLLPILPKGYKACLLKNEFGDIEGISHDHISVYLCIFTKSPRSRQSTRKAVEFVWSERDP